MKPLSLALVALAGLAALALWAEPAEATSTCGHGTGATGNWCEGYSHVSTATGGVASARCWSVRQTNTAPTCTTSGITPAVESAWQLTPGACTTLYFFESTTGAAPPADANKGVISIALEQGATTFRIYKDGTTAFDASGTSYQFCATSDGTATGSPRAGTVRIFLRAIKDNGPGGVGNYNVNSDGTATVGALISYDTGILRGQMTVSDITRNAYPSGSTFAYGPAGDETITITGTFTQPFGDNNVETMRTGIVDESTLLIGAAGATVDVDATTTLAQNYVADTTFPFANNPYVGALENVGNAVRTGLKWTVFATTGHCATCVRLSDVVVYNSADFNIDPRIVHDSDGAGTFATADDMWINKITNCSGTVVSAYNRGEAACTEGYLLNARDQQLTRAMTFIIEDAAAITCTSLGSLTPTSGKYSATYTVPTGGSCTVANTDPGSPRYNRATNTDQNHRSSQDHTVSSLYYVDSHTQISGTLVQDDFPTENSAEDFTFTIRDNGMGGDASDTIHGWCHVVSVRKDVDVDTSSSAVPWTLKDPTTATRASGTTDTGSDGWTGLTANFLSSTPLGTWVFTCTPTFNGNTGTYAQNIAVVVEGGGGGDTMADPLKVFPTPREATLNHSVLLSISAMFLDGTARLDAEDEILVDVYDPAGGAVITGASPTEVGGGIYRYAFTPEDGLGNYLVVIRNTDPETMGGATSNAFTVENSTITDLENSTMDIDIQGTSFNGLGIDGFLSLLFWIAAILFFTYQGWLFASAFAVPGLLKVLLPELPFDFTTYLVLCLLGFILEVAANRWSWGGYESGKRRLSFGKGT